MGNLFMHLEDASDEGRVGEVPAGGLDESETATAEIADLRQEEAEIVEAEGEADRLDDNVELAEDLAEEVEPVVTEGRGLDKAGMAILLTGMRAIAGRNFRHKVGQNVKMEAIDAGASGRAEQTKIVFEDLKDTLKSAWRAIKAAFQKAWAKIKTWFIKTFDASKKLKSRAEKIRTKAENTSATIDKRTFSFSGAKSLAVGDSLKDGSKVVSGLKALNTLADDILDGVKSDDVGSTAEKLGDLIGDAEESKLDSAINTLYDEVIGKTKYKGLTSTVSDSKIAASFGDSKEVRLKASEEFPGGKIVVQVAGLATTQDLTGRIAGIRRTRVAFSNARDKQKDVSNDVGTLSASQVASLCETVIDLADKVFDFKKGWENRDRDQAKTISAIDKAFESIGKDKDASTPGQRNARGLASAATGLLRRDASFKSAFVGYILTTANVALSYGEGSLRQHKK